MKAIVTGGSGFIGSNLVDELIDKNWDVIIIDQVPPYNDKAQYLSGDIRSQNIRKFVKGNVDVIFHLAALSRIQPSFDNPAETISVNSQGTVNVLELAKNIGAKVVYAGSSSFYYDPMANPYAYSKWVGENHCRLYSDLYGISSAIGRFFNVYGPRNVKEGPFATVVGIFEDQTEKGLPLTITGDGTQRRDFTHVSDIVSLPARKGEAPATLADIRDTQSKLGWTPKIDLSDYISVFLENQTIIH